MAESPADRKLRLDAELSELKAKSDPSDADKARIDVIENAEKPTPDEKVEANRDGGKPNLELRGLSVEERVKRLGFGS